MSTIVTDARLAASRAMTHPRAVRRRRYLSNAGVLLLSVALTVWSLAPIYNMVLISLEPEGDVFTDHIWPRVPSFESFWGVLTQGHWYLEHFWHQFANSFFIGAMVTFFALLFGSMTSFSIGRMRIRHGWLVSNAALLTYVIPASFLAIPFYRIMQNYGLANNPWSVIAALVVLAVAIIAPVLADPRRALPVLTDPVLPSPHPADRMGLVQVGPDHDLGARVHGQAVQPGRDQVGGQPSERRPEPLRRVIGVMIVLVGQCNGMANALIERPAAHGDGVGRGLGAVVQPREQVAVGID